jgi:hypothetical protein
VRRAAGNVMEEKRRAKPVPVPGLDTADVEVEVADDDADEDVLEDTSDLEDDDADAIVEVETEKFGVIQVLLPPLMERGIAAFENFIRPLQVGLAGYQC